MFANNDSVLSRATFKRWKLNDSLVESSETTNLLSTLTRDVDTHLKLDCDSCRAEASTCTCKLRAISFENTFKIFTILESSEVLGRTHWCNERIESSNFFMCDSEGVEIISAKLICDGTPHCNETRADESLSVCNPWKLKLVTISPTLVNFSLALLCVIIAIKRQENQEEGEEKYEVVKSGKKIAKALKLISRNLKSQSTENEKAMKMYIEKMSKREQLLLVNTSRHIEVDKDGSPESLFELAVESMFAVKAQTGILLGYIKNDEKTSMKSKREVLSQFEPKGKISEAKTRVAKKLPPQARIVLLMLKDILSPLVAIFTAPLQDIKDLCTIIALYSFYQDVLQGRLHLIDNLPINQYLVYLIVVFATMFVLKVMVSVEYQSPRGEDESQAYRCKIFGINLNLNMIPFVPEIRMNMEIFQLALTIFKKRNIISKLLENITSTEDEDEINQNWASIFSVSKEICNIELCGETIAEHKNLVKMTACLGKPISN